MKKIKFAIAIPTYNRIDKLKKTLNSVFSQKISEKFELSVVISNSASTDGTYEYLKKIKNKNFFIYNRKEIIDKNQISQFVNFDNLAKTIPENIDWVWWIGDDDHFASSDSIEYVVQKIIKYKNSKINFIHACQAQRFSGKSEDFEDTLYNLCNEFGYHELLGWMSSIILRKDVMRYTLNECSKNKKRLSNNKNELPSAFSHSAAIFKKYFNQKALLLDHPLIDPQDLIQTEETKSRWAYESVGPRYMRVIDDLLEFQALGLINKCSSNFLRYLNYKLWDHLAVFITSNLLDYGKKISVSNESINQAYIDSIQKDWIKLSELGKILESTYDIKQLGLIFQAGLNYSMLYINSRFNKIIGEEFIVKFKSLIGTPSHSFKLTEKEMSQDFSVETLQQKSNLN